MSTAHPPMLLSVVITIVDGGPALVRCLQAVLDQQGSPALEVIVPFDRSVADIAELADRFPRCRFLDIGQVRTAAPIASLLGQHELFDRRRSAGLAAATGDLVALLEDRGVPRATWAAAEVSLHAGHPYPVIGGAIENGRNRVLNWAVYFCDFGRYQLPFAPHLSRHVSDINVCYKRGFLESVRHVWSARYHEPTVHGAVSQRGEAMLLSPDLTVDQMRDGLTLGALCRERVAWGRLYAAMRGAGIGALPRIGLAAVSLLVPLLLLWRLVRDRIRKRRSVAAFLVSLPCIVLLLGAWCAGELTGYLRGIPRSDEAESA